MNAVKQLLQGFVIGAANIIPGVSGGTFLLIFGIYERTMSAVNALSGSARSRVISCFFAWVCSPANKTRFHALHTELHKGDFYFLVRLAIGSIIAIVSLARLLKYLLAYHQSATYGFFFGLILASVLVPLRRMHHKKLSYLFPFFIGVILTVAVSIQVDPVKKIEAKSQLYHQQHQMQLQSTAYTAYEYGMGAVAGAIAVSAMVLPGISGSLVLIVLGQYDVVLGAISGLKSLEPAHLIYLAIFALGMLAGAIAFVRLVTFVFKRAHDATMSLLIGLMLGSLWTLWPFKKVAVIGAWVKHDNAIIYNDALHVFTNTNILPSDLLATIPVAITFLVGGAIMLLSLKYEK